MLSFGMRESGQTFIDFYHKTFGKSTGKATGINRMEDLLRRDAECIIRGAIEEVLPDCAVQAVLKDKRFGCGKLILIAVGKAAWQMAKAATECLNKPITKGLIITKYGHGRGEIPGCAVLEAGHPVPDENSIKGAERAISLVSNLTEEDTVLFLLSGGGSALFEKPLLPPEEFKFITAQLLESGAGITEINTVRKRLSAVKGGKFARLCAPAGVCNIILSDIVGDPPDMIASGPTCRDLSTCEQADAVVRRYGLSLSEQARRCLGEETPSELPRVETHITGSVKHLCRAAAESCRRLGYEPFILTTSLDCTAREAGSFLAAIAREQQTASKSLAFIAGGETVVRVTGKGKGGRNQELALTAAMGISGLRDTAVFSFGSDGTDGPTDAAGGFADGKTMESLVRKGIQIERVLKENDAYHALQAVDGLLITGPTGTNVNDAALVLIKREKRMDLK